MICDFYAAYILDTGMCSIWWIYCHISTLQYFISSYPIILHLTVCDVRQTLKWTV